MMAKADDQVSYNVQMNKFMIKLIVEIEYKWKLTSDTLFTIVP